MDKLRYEDAAHVVTVTGWACKVCGHYWGDGASGERAARFCHGRDNRPCKTEGCPNRAESNRTVCSACRTRADLARWEATPKVDWDGETPLCEWDSDRYLWDEDDIAEYIADHLADGDSLEDIRLVMCRPNNGRCFDIECYLDDDLCEDHDGFGKAGEEINKIVNDWIAKHAPFSWEGTGPAVHVASLPMPLPDEPELED